MKKVQEMLEGEYKDVAILIGSTKVGTPEYDALSREADNIRKEMIEAEKINLEHKRGIMNLVYLAAGTGIGLLIQINTVNKSFKFDQTSTLTSTIGRNSVIDAATKLFKLK